MLPICRYSFYADTPKLNTLRLPLVTAAGAQITIGVAALADVIKANIKG